MFKQRFYLLSWFFLMLNLPLFGQTILDQKIDLNYRTETLDHILDELKSNYDILFTYSTIDLSAKVSIQYIGKLKGALDQIFKDKYIEYKVIGQQIALKYAPLKGQQLRGKVIDEFSNQPLVGATVQVIHSDPVIGAVTDENGEFTLEEMQIGRFDIFVNYLGYEPKRIDQVLVSTGYSIQLSISLKESAFSLEEAVVNATSRPSEPTNEMASSSARSFSVEETKRYAGAITDPARMVQVFAGVSSGGDDLSNEIIIRGNTSRNLLWRLEGVEIESPNHFGSLGGGGGAVSMLSSRTLADSDFYTGAFPAQFGNAISGVFDLQLRNGNRSKRQHSLSIGNLGAELSTEGYFKKGDRSSYLVNYRVFSTRFIEDFLPALIGQRSRYQDVTFKLNFPAKGGHSYSVFGLGGKNTSIFRETQGPNRWISNQNIAKYDEKQQLGLIGASHNFLINDQSYFRTVVLGSTYNYGDLSRFQDIEIPNREVSVDYSTFRLTEFTGAFNYHNKIDVQHYLHAGLVLNRENYLYDYVTTVIDTSLTTFFNDIGGATSLQVFTQWKYNFAQNWNLIAGMNSIYFFLNNTIGVDPRLSLEWKFKENQKLGIALGIYSKPEHSATYLIDRNDSSLADTYPNLNLKLMKAFHLVSSYQLEFLQDWRWKVEAYYQYLYNIPVSSNVDVPFSVLNTLNIFDIIVGGYELTTQNSFLVSKGIGINYGVEFTLEKLFRRGYYGLMTISLFDSRFAGLNKRLYPTFNARKILFNFLSGKEWQLGKRQNKIFSIDGRFTLNGGNRYTPVDLKQSRELNTPVFLFDQSFSKQVGAYLRLDFGVGYKLNRPSCTHTIRMDIQNLTNRRNISTRSYDDELRIIRDFKQNGLIPFISYRIEFATGKTESR